MKLGVCYYPEHWPESDWPKQAEQMRDLGITNVRIGEFAWTRIEPQRQRYQWAWLDRAIDTLASAGLKVVLGTPTACPPRWLIDELPEILPQDETGHPKGFGSRRHYCFSSQAYRTECDRIVTALAERYGSNPAIAGWQIDNELGHHGTVISHSPAAVAAFRRWLKTRYESIEQLNRAWGNVFWSMEYSAFDQINAPVGAVTESNPAHQLAWRRFSSDQVLTFADAQAARLRKIIPKTQWITTNFIGNFYDFDHYPLGETIDFASWDSYPLGFLEQLPFTEQERKQWRQIGHPDLTAFLHDLFRGVGRGRWGVMEQQPGPVNWAPHNAMPLPNAIRFWCWEAYAHDAELVSIFRWQQAPFAQEQMHAGLRCPDGSPAPASAEFKQFAIDLENFKLSKAKRASIAIVFDYHSQWISEIQPQDERYSAVATTFAYYRALRCLGLNIDIISCRADLSRYAVIALPACLMIDKPLLEQLRAAKGKVVIGPRSFSKTEEFSIPDQLPPGPLQEFVPLRVKAVDTLRPGSSVTFNWRSRTYLVEGWLESIESELEPIARTDAGQGLVFVAGRYHYLAGLTEHAFLVDYFAKLCEQVKVPVRRCERGLRWRHFAGHRIAFNFGPTTEQLPNTDQLITERTSIRSGEFAIWRNQ